jgi:hypothetical protein
VSAGNLPTEVVRRNRKLLAERGGWPAAALAECLKIEDKCPGFQAAWSPEWKPANPDFHREAGFYAWVTGTQPGQTLVRRLARTPGVVRGDGSGTAREAGRVLRGPPWSGAARRGAAHFRTG